MVYIMNSNLNELSVPFLRIESGLAIAPKRFDDRRALLDRNKKQGIRRKELAFQDQTNSVENQSV